MLLTFPGTKLGRALSSTRLLLVRTHPDVSLPVISHFLYLIHPGF